MIKKFFKDMIEKIKNRPPEDYFDPFSGTVALVPKEKRHLMKQYKSDKMKVK